MQPADGFAATLQRWIEVTMHRWVRSLICYARESGLSMSQMGALFHIQRTGHSGVTDLGDHLGVTSAASSQMLDRLEEQGLILRSIDPNDRRARQLGLTDKGRKVLEDFVLAHHAWLSDLAEALSESEKEATAAALRLLIDRANQLRQPVQPGA